MTHPNSENPIEGGGPTDAAAQSSLELTEQERPLAQADERVAEREPDLLEQVKEQAARGEMSAAQVTVRALIAREPGNARARAVLAGMLEKKGDVEGALAELGRALESAPDDVSTLVARATLLASRARYDQAEVDLRRAARINPRSPDVQVQLGILFSKRARWREAVEPLLAAIASDASHGDAHYYLGEAYNHIDELPAALSSYEMAATLQPNSMRALKGMGIVLDRMGRPVEAAAAYRRARDTQKR
ncbi:MAG: tetratricopeptide repeat protein [Gemmatimonadaceae bacterium]